MRGTRLAISVGALVLLASAGPASGAATAAGRGLRVSVVSCVTGNSHVATRLGCRRAPGAGFEGSQDSGLDGVLALASAGSRTTLYGVGNSSSALTQLALGAGRRLSVAGCLTGNTFVDACTALPGAASNAVEAPLAEPTAAAISPDGRSLYVVSGNFHAAVLARFARDPTSGALTYAGCITGDLGAGPAGHAGCVPLPTATRDGFGSGLDGPSGLAIGRDGRHVYVTAGEDSAVVSFARDPASGALSFVQCVSSNRRAVGCSHPPDNGNVLEGLGAPFLSPDGRFLYAAAYRGNTVSAFALGAAGTVRLASCVSVDAGERPCRPGRDPRGPVQALLGASTVTGSADGHFVYAASTFGSIVVLRRNRASGALTAVSCISSESEDRRRCATVPATPRRTRGTHHSSLLTGVTGPLAIGSSLLAPVRTIDGLARLHRNPQTGALSFSSCASADLELTGARGPCTALPGATHRGFNSGFYKTTALLPGPGGLLYAAASGDATVSALSVGSGAGSSSASLSAAPSGPVFWKNYRQPVAVEPARIDINYSTGFAWATGLDEWSGWGSPRATSPGVAHLNTCRPYCAAGNYKAYPAKVTLYKIGHCGQQRRYLDIKVQVGDKPPSIWGSECRGAQIVSP